MKIDLIELNAIAARVTEGEFNMYLSMYRGNSGFETCRVTLEKGSTHGKFHMKVEGQGETPSAAFETALRQFPPQPIDAHWDTQRIAGPVEDATFTETSTND